eukprot:TRINITY_DN22816_c0_g1_i1.p1 TRINITY_DN22816_c0_g1~~TRINITY_DN22816_c0_g1_i1.p1  ORF type:complete len:462 (+),score=90.26 TRINITY_DN22816_c0_g1_i1:41-1426(+)
MQAPLSSHTSGSLTRGSSLSGFFGDGFNTNSTGQTYQQMMRLCVNTPLGNFYILVNPTEKIDKLKGLAKEKVWEMYETLITVNRIQDEKRVDLPPSYPINSLLQDGAVILLNYTVSTPQPDSPTENYNHSPSSSSDDDSAFQSFLSSFDLAAINSVNFVNQTQLNQAAQPFQPNFIQQHLPRKQMQIVQQSKTLSHPIATPQPHALNANATTHTRQNSTSHTHSVPLRQAHFHKVQTQTANSPPKRNAIVPTREETNNDNKSPSSITWTEAPPQKVLQNKEFSFSIRLSSAANPATDDSKSPLGANSSGSNTTEAETPFEVSVEEEGKEASLTPNKYNIRVKKHDDCEQHGDIFTVFMRIRKNSHYGQTRFIIKVRAKNVDPSSQCATSGPIVVLSKIRNKRKRKPDDAAKKGSGPSQIRTDGDTEIDLEMEDMNNHTGKRRRILNNEAETFGLLNNEFNC